MTALWNLAKKKVNDLVEGVGPTFVPPPEKDMFQINGELSPNEFSKAGDHLISICTDWKWKASENKDRQSKYLKDDQQYLLLEKVICRRRLNSSLEL